MYNLGISPFSSYLMVVCDKLTLNCQLWEVLTWKYLSLQRIYCKIVLLVGFINHFISFPIAFMYHFGDPDWYERHVEPVSLYLLA